MKRKLETEARNQSSLGLKWELQIKLSPKFSVKKAHQMQRRISKKLLFKDTVPETVDYVAGVDVAYLKDSSVGAVAVLDFSTISS